MLQIKILPCIKSVSSSFTRAERKVAEIVLDNPAFIVHHSITEVSGRAGVADATVVRFCRKLGFKGYLDFRITLTQQLPQNTLNDDFSEDITPDDGVEDIIRKLVRFNHLAIDETVSLMQPDEVRKAIDCFDSASRITFYGSGNSGFMAQEAQLKFMRIGLCTSAYNDGHMMAMNAATLNEDDVAVGISFSGSSKDLVDAMEIAKRSGAKTVCITHHMKSPVTEHSDITLLFGSRSSALQSGMLVTRAAQFFVVDVLYTEYMRRNFERAQNILNRTIDTIIDKNY